MEGSGIPESERRAWNRVIGVGFVLLVGGSAGLVAFQGGGSPLEIAVVVVAGLLLGGLLLWYIASLRPENADRRRRR